LVRPYWLAMSAIWSWDNLGRRALNAAIISSWTMGSLSLCNLHLGRVRTIAIGCKVNMHWAIPYAI
jgi:hypothetical protein